MIGQLSGVYGYDGFDHRSGKFTYSTNPVYRGVIDFMLKLRNGDHIAPDSGSIGDEAARALFAQGKFGMMLNGTWAISGWAKTHPDFKDYTVTHVPFIGTTTPKSYFLTYKNGGSLYYINAQSKNLDAAWKTFKYLYSEPFGEEWVKGGNGDSIFPEANKPEFLDSTPALKTYYSIAPKFVHIGPDPNRKNPEWNKVKITPVNPTFGNVLQGLYTEQILMSALDKTLKEMDDARTKAYEQAVKDAQAAGAKVSLNDYIFPDWEPTKDYDNLKFIKK
jgi:ABC-type glycerol-3-phosphate transport system substrate-binding protein